MRRKKSFRKKLSIILLSLLIAMGATWVILANKFEQYVKEELPVRLEKISWLVKVDLASAKINKYLFNLSTNEVVVWPQSNYQFIAEGIDCSYNPLSENITIKLIGDKAIAKMDQTELYIEKPSDVISFYKPLLDGNLTRFSITLTAGKTNLKSKVNSTNVVTFDKADITITGEDSLIDDNYKININSDYKNLHLYAKSIKLAFNMSYELSSGLYLNLLESTGDFDCNIYTSFDLKKDLLTSFVPISHWQKTWPDILNKIDFFNDKYSLRVRTKLTNPSITNSTEVELGNDGKKITENLSSDTHTNYTDAQKQELDALLTDIFYVVLTSEKEVGLLKKDNLTKQDFEGITDKLINIKKANIRAETEYEKESKNFSHDFAFRINDHDLSLKGKGNIKEWLFDGAFKISNPQLFINGLADLIERGLYPVVKKSKDSEKNMEAEILKRFANNLKAHGFEALLALNNDKGLGEGEELIVNLKLNPAQLEFKLNDRNFLDIISDPRIKAFLQEGTEEAIPQTKTDIQNSDSDPSTPVITPDL